MTTTPQPDADTKKEPSFKGEVYGILAFISILFLIYSTIATTVFLLSSDFRPVFYLQQPKCVLGFCLDIPSPNRGQGAAK